jgi:DNA-binding HxlR family transcriptional regulator
MIDFDRLDKLIHEKGRLAIMTLLATRAEWRFGDLKQQLDMSDGNLITHLRTLKKADYLSLRKDQSESRPQSLYSLTKAGRTAFDTYLAVLEEIVRTGKS